jgi:hypothetical protein
MNSSAEPVRAAIEPTKPVKPLCNPLCTR